MNVDEPVHQQLGRALDLASQKKLPYVPFHANEPKQWPAGVVGRLPVLPNANEVGDASQPWVYQGYVSCSAGAAKQEERLSVVLEAAEGADYTIGFSRSEDGKSVFIWRRAKTPAVAAIAAAS